MIKHTAQWGDEKYFQVIGEGWIKVKVCFATLTRLNTCHTYAISVRAHDPTVPSKYRHVSKHWQIDQSVSPTEALLNSWSMKSTYYFYAIVRCFPSSISTLALLFLTCFSSRHLQNNMALSQTLQERLYMQEDNNWSECVTRCFIMQ